MFTNIYVVSTYVKPNTFCLIFYIQKYILFIYLSFSHFHVIFRKVIVKESDSRLLYMPGNCFFNKQRFYRCDMGVTSEK